MSNNATTLVSTFDDIATAINAKGVAGTMTPTEMPTKIGQIEDHTVEDALLTGELAGAYTNSRITDMKAYAFVGCLDLTNVSLPSITDVVSNYSFSGCSALETADFALATRIGTYAFRNCTSLLHATFPMMTHIYANAFNGCSSLEWLSFDDVTVVPTLDNVSAFSGCSALSAFYFPDDLVTTAQGTTNWATYSSIIKPLSQKPTS